MVHVANGSLMIGAGQVINYYDAWMMYVIKYMIVLGQL